MRRLTSSSSENTKQYAAELAHRILEAGPGHGATVLALEGDLGAGKTTFVQGFFKGLGIKRVPTSPTFILMRRTAIKKNIFQNVFHIDAYRADPSTFETLGIKEIFKDPRNLVLIEWPQKIKKLLPKRTIYLKFFHGERLEERKITLPS